MIKYKLSPTSVETIKLRKPKKWKEIIDYAEDKLKEVNANTKKAGVTGKITVGELTLGLEIDSYEEEDIVELRKVLLTIYEKIKENLKEYIDLRDEHYDIIATWIIGTYIHENFSTYPYLYLNAMRGSGKTRLLGLIAAMSRNGKILLSPTESVMFRISKETTLCLDELEGIMKKENAGLREILNACYKRGSTVTRMKQQKTPEGTEYLPEEFEPYKPICIANIWGMEEVLGDRCIPVILEKSDRKDVMRLIEDFDNKPSIIMVKTLLCELLVQLCSFISVDGGVYKWNYWVKQKYTTPYTHTTYNTLTTQTTQVIPDEVLKQSDIDFFEKIDSAGIIGRNLELFFPLITIASFLGEDNLNRVIEVAKQLNLEKTREEMTESKDVSLIDYISRSPDSWNFKSVKLITDGFRAFVGNIEEADDKWLNEKWVGRALKRLNLVVDKRRMSCGVEVTVNKAKALEKMQRFGTGEEKK